MTVKTIIRLADQVPVEPPLARPRFVSGNQENRVAPGIEGKSHLHSPSAALNGSSFILARALQGVHARPPQLRTELLQKAGQRQDFRSHVLRQREEFRIEVISDRYSP